MNEGMFSATPPVRVLYIMGVGRSGSTVLDSILGNHPQVVSVGELCHLADRGWVNGEFCACGQSAIACSWWSQVRQRWTQLCPQADPASYAALVQSVELGPLATLRLGTRRRLAHERFEAYTTQTGALLQAVAEVSGKSIIVDSSKRCARALALARIPGVDLRVIHLVRDGRGVAWSLQKKFAEDPRRGLASLNQPHRAWRSSTIWLSGNLQSAWVRRALPPKHSMRLRYEDFVEQPAEALARIGRLVGLDMAGLAAQIAAGAELPIGHAIAGNRMRMAGRVRLRLDNEWTEKMSEADQRTCWLLSGWLLQQYGYRRSAA